MERDQVKDIGFYFDEPSQCNYLGWTQSAQLPVTLVFYPIDVVPLMERLENVLTSTECATKSPYLGRDLMCWAARDAAPFGPHLRPARSMPESFCGRCSWSRGFLHGKGCEIRLPCHSCKKIRPSLA